MDTSSRPATKSSSNGSPTVAAPVAQGPQSHANYPDVVPQQQDKRQSLQHYHPTSPQPTQKRIDQLPPKRSGFGIFGKFNQDDDERDQMKRLKAENKQLRTQMRDLEIRSSQDRRRKRKVQELPNRGPQDQQSAPSRFLLLVCP